jgi:hypothetical protein
MNACPAGLFKQPVRLDERFQREQRLPSAIGCGHRDTQAALQRRKGRAHPGCSGTKAAWIPPALHGVLQPLYVEA